MPIGLYAGGTFDYTLKSEQDKPGATVFSLRFLQGTEHDKVRSLFDREGQMREPTTDELDGVLRLGLRGWTHFKDPKGADISFDPITEGEVLGLRALLASPASVARIPTISDKHELVGRLIFGCGPTADEAKKSKSPQP